MIHKFSEHDINDLQDQADRYPVTEENIQHGKRFWKIIAWAASIIACLYGWAWLIIRFWVRP